MLIDFNILIWGRLFMSENFSKKDETEGVNLLRGDPKKSSKKISSTINVVNDDNILIQYH